MNRRTFLRRTSSAAFLLGVPTLSSATRAAATTTEEELLAEARERIAWHRRGPGRVIVRTPAGRPVPGANVEIVQTRHEFLFGCNFFRFGKAGRFEEDYRGKFADLLNYATLGFYWSSYERERGRPGYEYTDDVLRWCRDRGLTCKGHPLVWDHPAGSPGWLPADDAELARLSNGRVREIVERFQGRLDLWDVVNEATHLPDRANATRMARWGEGLGRLPYTRVPLEIARAANPQATLLVNDYRTDPPYFDLLNALRDDSGRLLYDVVGIQSHMHDGGWPLARVREICDRYARVGLPIHFTETTVVSGPRTGPGENWGSTTPELEAKQADYVARLYTLLFGHPAVQALTWWDFSDDGAWQRAAAGLVRKDMSPKPVYERLQALIKGEWWTRFQGKTDAEGVCAVDPFFGRHRVTVKAAEGRMAEQDAVWKRGRENRVEITLG